ncbi:hypothetical protein ACIPSR_02825 [Pectobacterium sp. CHL-2024]|nr:hypothetical protein [Pectobacterium brasiliense]
MEDLGVNTGQPVIVTAEHVGWLLRLS